MFSNYLDYENFGNLSQREKSRYKQAQSYLDANPQFEERFLGLTERYPELPPVMLKDLAETNVDLDGEALIKLVNTWSQQKQMQAANDWAEVSKDYKSKGYNDDMTSNMLKVFGGGAVLSNALFMGRRAIDAVIPGQIPTDIGEYRVPGFGMVDFTPEDFTNPVEAFKNTTLWTMATFDAMSELFVKYTPSYRSSIQKPYIDEKTGEYIVPEEYNELNPLEQGMMGIPGLNLLVPGNKALFNGRTWAYAQQMNALDEYLENGYTQEDAQQFIPINLTKSTNKGLGAVGSWLQETKDWIGFAQEAKEKGGSPYLFEMLNQVRSGQAVNYNRDNWLTVESLMAKNSKGDYKPEVLELMQRGWSENDAMGIFYKNNGAPIVKPNTDGDINWTSIQRPNQIEAFAGRKFIYNPELADEYAEKRQSNLNEILGIEIPYSSGRYQASLRADVGSTEYQRISGWIDGRERILPELIGGGAVKAVKKASKLTRTINRADKFTDVELDVPIQTKNIINDYVKTNKVNPITGDTIDDVDDFLTTFDSTNIKRNQLVKPLQKEIKNTSKAIHKIKRDWFIFGGRATGMFNLTTDKVVNHLTDTGMISKLVKNKELNVLNYNPWTKDMPERMKVLLTETNNTTDMQDIFRKVYSDQGIKTPGMSLPFKLDELPKGQSYMLQNAVKKVTGNAVSIPSMGSLLGRTANKTLRTIDKVGNIPRKFNTPTSMTAKISNLFDTKKVLDKEEFYKWQATGESNFNRNLGFYSEFSAGMSPQWKKMFSIQPTDSLNYYSRDKAWTSLIRHLDSTGYDDTIKEIVLKDFVKIENWNVSSANKFAKRLQQADVQQVRKRAGDTRAKVLERRLKAINKDNEISQNAYMADQEGVLINNQATPRIFNQTTGETVFIPSASKLSEAADQGAPLTNNRMMNRLLGRYFQEIETLVDNKYFIPAALDTMKQNIKTDGFFAGLKIPTRKIENDMFTMTTDLWTNTFFKPKVIAKQSLTTRVLFEEQLAFLIHPNLTSFLDHPIQTLNWIFSYGQLPKRAPVRALMKRIIDSGEDVNDVILSQVYHEALQANFAFNGLNTKHINKKNINYVAVSPDNEKHLDAFMFQYGKIRNNPLQRKLVELGWGNDKLNAWMDSEEAAKMIEDVINTLGPKYEYIRTKEGFVDYLSQLEFDIRARTGMSMKKGKHYGVYENGPRKGESWFDNSYDDLGDQALRQGILTGKIDAVVKDEIISFDLPALNQEINAKWTYKQQKAQATGFQKIMEQDTFDAGKLYVGNEIKSEKALAKLGDALDNSLNNIFNFLLTEPLARLHRSPVFKQYRWNYISSHFETFTPALQKKFINEAKTAKIPSPTISSVEGLAKLKSGKIDNYQTVSDIANSYGLAEMKQLLYDTKTRHRISEISRNVFPFPEVFFEMARRWGKLTALNPYFIRQGALTYKGAKAASNKGQYFSFEGQGVFKKDEQTGEDMFITPGNKLYNNFLFGQDSNYKIIAKGYGSGVNMISSQGFPSTTPLVAWGVKNLFDEVGVKQELADDFYGAFPPPDNFMEAIGGGPSSMWTKLRAAIGGTKVGIDLVREAISDTYVDDDNNYQYWEMDSKIEHMRAESSIDVWESIKSSHDEERLLSRGELDKYIRSIYPEWDGNREIFEIDDLANAYAANNNLPLDLPKGVLTPAILDKALMKYSAHKGRWLNLYRFLTQEAFLTGAVFKSAVKDKSGKWWMTAVLADEYSKLQQKYKGDSRAAAEEFYSTFGFEHAYVTTSSKERDARAITFNASVKTWKEKNKENLILFPTTYQYLNYDNPELERSYSDMIAQATLNPEYYMQYANDTAASVHYNKMRVDIEENPNLSNKEKDFYKDSYKLALMDIYPGFLSAFGQTDTPTSQVRFDEMRNVWMKSDFALDTEAGKGFEMFLEGYKKAEEISKELGYSKTWFRNSKDPVAFTLRSQLATWAFATIEKYPDFYPIWQNVIIRLMSSDREFLKYNTALETRRQQVGTK